jgi:hypothetical protein
MNDAFLDCNILSINLIDQPYNDHNFFLIEKVYYYNSLTSGIIVFNPGSVQIPEFEIRDIHLLDGLDYDFINKENVPILSRIDNNWKIDLTLYHKLMSEHE